MFTWLLFSFSAFTDVSLCCLCVWLPTSITLCLHTRKHFFIMAPLAVLRVWYYNVFIIWLNNHFQPLFKAVFMKSLNVLVRGDLAVFLAVLTTGSHGLIYYSFQTSTSPVRGCPGWPYIRWWGCHNSWQVLFVLNWIISAYPVPTHCSLRQAGREFVKPSSYSDLP